MWKSGADVTPWPKSWTLLLCVGLSLAACKTTETASTSQPPPNTRASVASGEAVALDEQRFRGEWGDPRGNRGALLLVTDAAGKATIEFLNTSCRGERPIPAGELGLVDGKLSIVGDGAFDIDIGGACGPASVVARETANGELRLDFRRRRHNDTFFATISRT